MAFKIHGKVIEEETGKGIPNLTVKAIDKDLLFDDLLGAVITDENGNFEIKYDKEDFQELFFDKKPDIYLKIKNPEGAVIHSTEDKVIYESSETKEFNIKISKNKIKKEKMAKKNISDWTLENGKPAEVWSVHEAEIGKFIKGNDLKATPLESLAHEATMESGQMAMREHETEMKASQPAIDIKYIIDIRGGRRGPHLHYRGQIYLLNAEQWKMFSGGIIQKLGEKLAKANTVNFEQFMELSDAMSAIH
jgi:hypothetical protein